MNINDTKYKKFEKKHRKVGDIRIKITYTKAVYKPGMLKVV